MVFGVDVQGLLGGGNALGLSALPGLVAHTHTHQQEHDNSSSGSDSSTTAHSATTTTTNNNASDNRLFGALVGRRFPADSPLYSVGDASLRISMPALDEQVPKQIFAFTSASSSSSSSSSSSTSAHAVTIAPAPAPAPAHVRALLHPHARPQLCALDKAALGSRLHGSATTPPTPAASSTTINTTSATGSSSGSDGSGGGGVSSMTEARLVDLSLLALQGAASHVYRWPPCDSSSSSSSSCSRGGISSMALPGLSLSAVQRFTSRVNTYYVIRCVHVYVYIYTYIHMSPAFLTQTNPPTSPSRSLSLITGDSSTLSVQQPLPAVTLP